MTTYFIVQGDTEEDRRESLRQCILDDLDGRVDRALAALLKHRDAHPRGTKSYKTQEKLGELHGSLWALRAVRQQIAEAAIRTEAQWESFHEGAREREAQALSDIALLSPSRPDSKGDTA